MPARLNNYTHTAYAHTLPLPLFFRGKLLRGLIWGCFVTARNEWPKDASHISALPAEALWLSYLVWKGVVDVICMLSWCSNSSLNASSAEKNCDCMVGEQTSVSDDISLGLLCYPGWDIRVRTIKTSLSFHIHLSPTQPSALLSNICMHGCLCVEVPRPRVCCALWQRYVKYLILQP